MTEMTIPKQYEQQYSIAEILPAYTAQLGALASVLRSSKTRYKAVGDQVGMPWYLVGAIHRLEASGDFRSYLQNGDPLFNSDGRPVPTVHVPSGVGPFDPQTWENAAVAALGGLKAYPTAAWNIGQCLDWAERYNGLGYRHLALPSPYLWSFTDQYKSGKYVSDGVFDPNFVSQQPGVAAIFKALCVK